MSENIQHPIQAGTRIRIDRGRSMQDTTVVSCQGQLGRQKVWWYRCSDGRRWCEYHIVCTLGA
jgi:hypothetical protein